MRTPSMTWMTPLVLSMSVCVTLTLLPALLFDWGIDLNSGAYMPKVVSGGVSGWGV